MDQSDYARKISALLQERLRIRGRSLSQQIHKSGRRMPKRIKRAAKRVDDAALKSGNPKLARQVDPVKVKKDATMVIEHLSAIDPMAAMWDRILMTLAKISAVLIIAFVITIWVMHSRGMI